MCGEGLTAQRLALSCKLVIGVDQSERLIAKGRGRVGHPPEPGAGVDGVAGPVASPPPESCVNIGVDGAPTADLWSNLHLHTGDGFDSAGLLHIVDTALGIERTTAASTAEEKKQMKKKGKQLNSWGAEVPVCFYGFLHRSKSRLRSVYANGGGLHVSFPVPQNTIHKASREIGNLSTPPLSLSLSLPLTLSYLSASYRQAHVNITDLWSRLGRCLFFP